LYYPPPQRLEILNNNDLTNISEATTYKKENASQYTGIDGGFKTSLLQAVSHYVCGYSMKKKKLTTKGKKTCHYNGDKIDD
jgi:hypothetical protein